MYERIVVSVLLLRIQKNLAILCFDEIIKKYMHSRDTDTNDQAKVSNASKSEEIHTFRLKLLNESDDWMQLFTRNMFRSSTLCVILCLGQCEQPTSIKFPVNEFISIAKIDDSDQIGQNSLKKLENQAHHCYKTSFIFVISEYFETNTYVKYFRIWLTFGT